MVALRTERVERERLRRAMTRSEFARMCGLSSGSRTRVFRGDPVALSSVRKIADAVGVDVSKLIDVEASESLAMARRRSAADLCMKCG